METIVALAPPEEPEAEAPTEPEVRPEPASVVVEAPVEPPPVVVELEAAEPEAAEPEAAEPEAAEPVIEEPVVEPPPDPVAMAEPEPEEPEIPDIDLSGQWIGAADSRPLQLRITDSGGSVRAEFSFLLGTTPRTIIALGTFDPASGAFRATSSAEGLTFQGRLSGNTLSGSYQKGKRGKAFSWSASR